MLNEQELSHTGQGLIPERRGRGMPVIRPRAKAQRKASPRFSPRLQADARERVIARAIYAALEDLTEKQQKVIRQHYGLCLPRPCTLEEIAQDLGVTRVAVWRIEQRALSTLSRSSMLRKVFRDHIADG